LTVAVSSQRVTEEHEGALIMVGPHEISVTAQARLTEGLTILLRVAVVVRGVSEAAASTRGPEWTNPWCSGCVARRIAG